MRISFIVPTRNSVSTVETCLGSIRTQRHDDLELVVVDDGSHDGTPLIAQRYADVVFDHGPGRSAQRNAGAARSTGDVLVFVDPGMTLEDGAARKIDEHFSRLPELGALVIPERSYGQGFLARCRGLEMSLHLGDPGAEAPRAFRREVFDKVGGWCEGIVAGEEWELADRTRDAGVVIGRLNAFLSHDEGRVTLGGAFQQKRDQGRRIGRHLREHTGAGRRAVVGAALLVHPDLLWHNPMRAAGMFVLKAVETTGVVAGVVDDWRKARTRW